MQKVIQTKDNFRIVQNERFNFASGATRIFYTVEQQQETEKTVEKWYGCKTVTVTRWIPVTISMMDPEWSGLGPQIFKSKKIAERYVTFRIKHENPHKIAIIKP